MLLFVLISLLPLMSGFFKPGFYAAHDAVWHIARFWQFHLSFETGQIPVRWAPTLLYGLGYPAFIVNFHLPYYLMEIIYRFGPGLVDAYKILLALSYVLGVFAFYFYLKRFFGALPSFAGAVVFAYAPYRFATLFARGALGEAVAISVVPLVLLAFDLWRSKNKYAGPFLALSLFLLITSHASIFVVFLPIILMLGLIASFKKKSIDWAVAFWIGLGIISTSFQTLPALFEKKYMVFDQIYKNVYLGHFANLFTVLRFKIGGADLNTPFQLGLAGTLSVLTFLALFLRKLKVKRIVDRLALIYFLGFLIALLMMIVVSKPLWAGLPFLNLVLFPWRFINLLLVASAFLCAYVVERIRIKFLAVVLVVFLAIFPGRHFWGWVGQIPQGDNYYMQYDGTTTAEGEFTPKGVAEGIYLRKDPKIEIVNGNAKILDQNVSANNWQFAIDAAQNSLVKLSILNFPGWKVRVDESDEKIIGDYKDDKNDLRGLVVFKVASGFHNIKVRFEETPLRKTADVVSLVSLLVLAIFLTKSWRKT